MKLKPLLIFAILFASCKQQTGRQNTPEEDSLNTIAIGAGANNNEVNTSAAIIPFIPSGYEISDTCSGDLNRDEFTDMLVALKAKNEDSLFALSELGPNRLLFILIGQPAGDFRLAKRNDKILYSGKNYSENNGGVCYLKVKNGYFSIEEGVMGGPQHWLDIITFKYNPTKANWYLFKKGGESYSLNSNTDPNAEAMIKHQHKIQNAKDFGIISFEKFNIYTDKN